MDPDSLGATFESKPRKVKFQPKGPPRREQKPLVLPKAEKVEYDIDAAKEQELLRRFNELGARGRVKQERKVTPSMVAFGPGSTTSLRSYGNFKGKKLQGSSSDGAGLDQAEAKEYKEPWDYRTNYPVTLPLRRPYSGNPELLDQAEFGETSVNFKYDETASKAAIDLNIMEGNPEPRLLFFQLPEIMPMVKQSDALEGNGADNSSTSKRSGNAQQKASRRFIEMPAGSMGKMLVYNSGAVKLKLGDTLYEVSAGLDCIFAQDLIAINAEEKQCTVLGELDKCAIITPDVDSILDSILED